MGLSVQPVSSPNITSVSGVPTKAAFYQSVANAPSSTPNSAFYNNPYGVSAQEIDGMQRANPYTSGSVTNTGSTGGGGGGGGAANPYLAAFQAALPGQLSSIQSTENDASQNARVGVMGSIRDLVAQLTNDQSGIDNQGVQNELAKRQGTQGVLEMVQHGLQSGGVTLANKNASNSSAADALARAYGDIGRRAQTQVGTQYEKGVNSQELAQTQFNTNKAAKMGDIQDAKTQAINNVVADAQNKLSYLEAQAVSAGLPNSVNIEAQKQQVRNNAIAALADIDQQLASGVGGVHQMSQSDQATQAAQLLQKGTAPAAPFSYTTAAPAQFQNTGPSASNLPIFIAPSSKKQGA